MRRKKFAAAGRFLLATNKALKGLDQRQKRKEQQGTRVQEQSVYVPVTSLQRQERSDDDLVSDGYAGERGFC